MHDLKYWKTLFDQGVITRREFMQKMAVLGIGTAFATQILAGTAFAQEPQTGGHCRIGIDGGSTTDSLDPTTYIDSGMYLVGSLFGNRMTTILPDGGIEGDIVESWEASDGAKRWLFNIRPDVIFHNGKPLTAADVSYSLNRHIGEDTTSGAKGLLEGITAINALSEREVEILHETGNADMPYLLAAYQLVIQPEGDIDSGIGTGPFILESFEPGVRIMLSKNPGYHHEGRPYFDSAEVVVIKDVTARMAAIRTGQVDLINSADPKTVHLLQRSRNLTVYNVPSGRHVNFSMFVDTPPYDNLDLRLALKHAIDRESIVKNVYRGFGAVGNDHPINSAYALFEDAVPQRTYDPDKAAEHYKKSGHTGTIELHTADVFPGGIDAAVLFKESAAAAGISIDVRREPADGYYSDVWLVKPFSGVSWLQRPTQDAMLSIAYKSDASWNESHWKREDFDNVLIAARTELDQDKRAGMYTQLQTMLNEEGGTILPVFINNIDVATTKLQGYVNQPVGFMMNYRIAEYAWFEG